jgi:hypothetical protein
VKAETFGDEIHTDKKIEMKTMLSMPRTSSRTVNVNSPIHAFGSLSHSMNDRSVYRRGARRARSYAKYR